jgi:hypothetical protein
MQTYKGSYCCRSELREPQFPLPKRNCRKIRIRSSKNELLVSWRTLLSGDEDRRKVEYCVKHRRYHAVMKVIHSEDV